MNEFQNSLRSLEFFSGFFEKILEDFGSKMKLIIKLKIRPGKSEDSLIIIGSISGTWYFKILVRIKTVL